MPLRFLALDKAICALAILAATSAAAAPASPPLYYSARHIEVTLAALGYTVTRQHYVHEGKQVSNIEISLINTIGGKRPESIFIVGANDSGAAAVLELARRLKGIHLRHGTELKFVFFVNEEERHFGVEGALSKRYPATGNFIAFIGTQASSALVRKALAAFRATAAFRAEGLAAASYVEGVTWSGHAAYNRHGYPAIMITDTAFLRYPYYHTAQDAPDRLDYHGMARVVDGLAKVIEGLAAPVRM